MLVSLYIPERCSAKEQAARSRIPRSNGSIEMWPGSQVSRGTGGEQQEETSFYLAAVVLSILSVANVPMPQPAESLQDKLDLGERLVHSSEWLLH